MGSDEAHNASGARCTKCGGSDTNRLLVCCEDDCATVLHEECMAVRAQLDVFGYFRCPKCAVKWIDGLCARSEKLLEDSATKLGNWISRAVEESRMEVDDEGENSGASAWRDFENVEGGERQEPLVVEPLLTVRLLDVQGRSIGGEGVAAEEHEQGENNGTRVLPESLSKTFFNSTGRRRVLWTEDEIKALEEGVQNIWNPNTRKNIPWEKILGAYRDRFHSSRTAANLKDKWKSMTRPKI